MGLDQSSLVVAADSNPYCVPGELFVFLLRIYFPGWRLHRGTERVRRLPSPVFFKLEEEVYSLGCNTRSCDPDPVGRSLHAIRTYGVTGCRGRNDFE